VLRTGAENERSVKRGPLCGLSSRSRAHDDREGTSGRSEDVNPVGRRGALGLVARERDPALLADDAGRTALHAAPAHGAAGDALLGALRVVGELHGRRAAGLRQLHTAATRSRVSVSGAVAATRWGVYVAYAPRRAGGQSDGAAVPERDRDVGLRGSWRCGRPA